MVRTSPSRTSPSIACPQGGVGQASGSWAGLMGQASRHAAPLRQTPAEASARLSPAARQRSCSLGQRSLARLPGLADGRQHFGAHVACDRPVDEVQVQVVQLQRLRERRNEKRARTRAGVRHLWRQARQVRAPIGRRPGSSHGEPKPALARWAGLRQLPAAASARQPSTRAPPRTLSDLRQAWRTRAALWSLFHALEQM